MESLELTDWVGGLKLDPESYREVVEDLRDLVRRHLYEEGVVARNLKMRSEMQHVRDALVRAKQRLSSAAFARR